VTCWSIELDPLGSDRLEGLLRGRDNARLAMLAELSDLDRQPHQQAARHHQPIEQCALGIDDAYRNPGLAQRLAPPALIAAAGLHHRQPNRMVAQPGDQLLLPAGVLGCDSYSCRERMHASAFSLETSMPTILSWCGILPLSSLLVRALAPKQLFGFKEDGGPVPRSPSEFSSGGHGLRSSDGRLRVAAARSHTLPHLPDTRVPTPGSQWGGAGEGRPRTRHSSSWPEPTA
jgi:hypothetical protein